jgi:hypothetical protein
MAGNLNEGVPEASVEPFVLAIPSRSSSVRIPDDDLRDKQRQLQGFLDQRDLRMSSHTTTSDTMDTDYSQTGYDTTVHDGNDIRHETDYKQDSEVVHHSDEKEDWD